MQNAIWLAAVFGPYLIIRGLWMLFYHENTGKIWTSIKNTPAVFHLGAVITLWLGLAVVNTYNIWMMNLTFFVTLLGWVMLVKGVFALFLPQVYFKTMMHSASIRVWGVIGIIWGLLLCWLAFWM
jgi:hypothetical protein